jgi:hypothetical protein
VDGLAEVLNQLFFAMIVVHHCAFEGNKHEHHIKNDQNNNFFGFHYENHLSFEDSLSSQTAQQLYFSTLMLFCQG